MATQSGMQSSAMLSSQLVEQSPANWLVKGDINFDSVIALRRQGVDAVRQASPVCRFDFSGVGSVNTMALSLILCWSRAAKQAGIELQLSHVPAALHAIAELSDLQSLLASD